MCHRAQQISLPTFAENDFDVTSGDWTGQTDVDSGGTRALLSGRAVGIQGDETKKENP